MDFVDVYGPQEVKLNFIIKIVKTISVVRRPLSLSLSLSLTHTHTHTHTHTFYLSLNVSWSSLEMMTVQFKAGIMNYNWNYPESKS